MKQMSVKELQERREAGSKLVLLDVRENDEVDYCKIAGAVHIPMNQVPLRLQELNPQDTVVVYCHKGARSMQVCRYLEGRGFKEAYNLLGGITQWSLEIDPSVPMY